MNIALRRPLPPSRTRRIAKWSGLVVCDLLVSAWAVSTVIGAQYRSPRCSVALAPGQVYVGYGSVGGWVWWRHSFDAGLVLRPLRMRQVIGQPGWRSPGSNVAGIGVPLWTLLTLAAIPTAILWRRDRRPKPGHCGQCGYDLRASKKTCPECGTAIA